MLSVWRNICREKSLWTGRRIRGNWGWKQLAFLLYFVMLAVFLSVPETAAANEKKLSDIVEFQDIALYYSGADGQPAEPAVQDHELIDKSAPLALYYKYEIPENKISYLMADTNYYLDVSPHLVLSDLSEGSPLEIETEDGPLQFGTIFADGNRAWVTFKQKDDSTDTVLSDFNGLNGAYFYVDCSRADAPPADELPINGEKNLYAMKFENGKQLCFGYAENEPIEAKAQIQKEGVLSGKTITWTITHIPWQNPSEDTGINMETSFELRDTIDTSLHSYVENSVKINGLQAAVYQSRENIDTAKEAYVLVEPLAEGDGTVLTFGGTKFKAKDATPGNPAKTIQITYDTVIRDELLLPGNKDGQKVTNTVELFAETDGVFSKLDISGRHTVPIPQPAWLTKTGQTTRHTDGTGSVTDWTVTLFPNGFQFDDTNKLTVHDVLPDGSTLTPDSLKVDGVKVSAATAEGNGFTVTPIKTNNQPVTITYQTRVPEDMYDNGTDLGKNAAWITFRYNGADYVTPEVTAPVGSGDGSGTSGTATLVKSNGGYNAAKRTIDWTVTINPHKANLKSGTFIDDLSAIGGNCKVDGHMRGLELVGGLDSVQVLIDGKEPEIPDSVELEYGSQVLKIRVQEIGAKCISLFYTTRVCDPCVFANNTETTAFKNTIITTDMKIGNQDTERAASADSTAAVSAAVLSKKMPVYDYASGIMKWIVEVDASGLPMEEVALTDILPVGLTYVKNSLSTVPAIADAIAKPKIPDAAGQELEINLGNVNQKTLVAFETKVDPEKIGFNSNENVKVVNTVTMSGKADGVKFAEVSHKVEQSFSNHGLVKSNRVDNKKELIQYEVLVNPFGLALPENPYIIDTLDSRLQLDTDTLYFYHAKLSGTTDSADQRPEYVKIGEGVPMKVAEYDPASNTFKVQLPVKDGSREPYVLTYTADIIERQTGNYSNSVRFDGGSVLLGGNKNNSASVSGGGGGGGGGVADRKAGITITKSDSENQKPLEGVTFTLYQWDKENNTRGLPFVQEKTDISGKLSFKVKPNTVYELVETKGINGYYSIPGWRNLPDGTIKTEDGILITAGNAKSDLKLNVTNDAYKTDVVFRLLNKEGIPLTGERVYLFVSDPSGQTSPLPDAEAVVSANGTVRFSGLRRGTNYFIRCPGGEVITVEIPLDINGSLKVKLADGTETILTENNPIISSTTPEQEWALTVTKVNENGTKALSGAVIGLYAEKNCQTLLKSGISGQNGKVVFSGLMKGQTYYVRELAPPKEYDLDVTVHKAGETEPAVMIFNTLKKPSEDPSAPKYPEASKNPDKSDIGKPGASAGSRNKTSGNPRNTDNSGKTDSGIDHFRKSPQTGDPARWFSYILIVSLSMMLSGILLVRFIRRFLRQKQISRNDKFKRDINWH